MKRFITIHILILALMTGLEASVSAKGGGGGQGDPRVDRIRMEMEQTDQIIERAKDAVDVSKAPAAKLALEKAMQLQQRARDEFQKGNLNGYLAASKLTRDARNLAKKALVASRYSEQNEDRVLARLDRVQDLLDRAREMLNDSDNKRMRPLFDLAVDNMDKAWQFYRSNQHRVALKLADHVESTARRIMQASGRGPGTAGQYTGRMENLERHMERLRQRMQDGECGSEAAKKFMEQAERAAQISREAAARGDVDIAFESLQQAQRLASEAAGYCENGYQLQHQYERMKARLDDLSEEVPSGTTAHEILDQATRQLELAKQKIRDEEFDAAAAALRVAQMQLRQVEEQLRSGTLN